MRQISTDEHSHLIFHSPKPNERLHPGHQYDECAGAATSLFEEAYKKFQTLDLKIYIARRRGCVS